MSMCGRALADPPCSQMQSFLSYTEPPKSVSMSVVTVEPLRPCVGLGTLTNAVGARVLLVENEEALRDSIVRALRARGVGVDPFATPREALSAVEGGGVWSRALIDLALPEMDGATLAEKLLQHLPELEITFITGGIDASVLCKAHGLGAVIWKPLGLGPLCERFMVHRSSGFVSRVGHTSSRTMRAVDRAAAGGKK